MTGMGARAHGVAIAAVLGAAAALLFSRLGAVYLWQDEALTAILGERMMRHGKPLSWDGVNVVTQDNFAAEDFASIDGRTGSAEAAIGYFKARGDFKEDTTWVLHPWGQFLAAGLSLAALGHGTWQARLPFALAAFCTVLLLYMYAARAFASRSVALVAALLLTGNSYWILHARQCRYYALSSLALLLSVAAWDRWQRGGRFGAAAFAAAGFFYFQVEFGSFFPSMAVLAALAVAAAWPRPLRALRVFAALAAAVAPFAWYYELYGRRFASLISWRTRFVGNLFNMNQYLVALPIVAVGAWMLWRRRDVLPARQREVLVATVALIAVMLVWVPSVAPFHYHRYIVQLTPLAALLVAWTAGQIADRCAPSWRTPALAGCIALAALSALPSWPVTAAILAIEYPDQFDGSLAESVTRSELLDAGREIFEERPDPNRATVEFLQARLRSGDEVITNYEDFPLMFYTGARIRGGISAFRVEDRSAPPARFLVLRKSVPFGYWPVYRREARRWKWRFSGAGGPDVPFGNNPDPSVVGRQALDRELVIGEFAGEADLPAAAR
ncbi:MAG TPA: hypothetical protein VFL36_02775 [Myxococcales bacterium]|nr:hypothetical protein [Myxococcales bacterium]